MQKISSTNVKKITESFGLGGKKLQPTLILEAHV